MILWRTAVSLFLAAMIALVLPNKARAVVELGDIHFTWAHLLVLLAAAAAWGDMRRQSLQNAKDIAEIRKYLMDRK